MTGRTLLVGASLLANASLVIAYLAAPTPRPSRASAATQPESAPASRTALPATAGESPSARSSVPREFGDFSWAAVETNDLDLLAARLKAVGFSPADVRAILQQRISEISSAGRARADAPYWRAPRPGYLDPEAAAETRRKTAEQMRLVRRYSWGPDSFDDPERVNVARRSWGDLPVDKLRAIAAIESDYAELSMQQYAERRYRPGEDRATDAMLYRMMEQERLADIAKVLSPEEFEAFELRASPMAMRLRQGLETFRPDEAEYKALFAIHKAYRDRTSDPTLSPDARKALTAEILAQVSGLLGPDRAADYDAAMSQNSRDQTGQLVARLNLPARVAAEVRQAQANYTSRAKAIRADPALPAAERGARLEALAREAELELRGKLGADGFEAYGDLKGEWLRAIKPKPGG